MLQVPGGRQNAGVVQCVLRLEPREAIMGPMLGRLLCSLLTVGFALSVSAQDRKPDQIKPKGAVSEMPSSSTGKERLGRKWMDEQRIDNCKVPPDKRGTKPRPNTCPHVPTG